MDVTSPIAPGNELSLPGYLHGNWTYDPMNKWLISGPDIPEANYAEYLASIGANSLTTFAWSGCDVGQCGISNPGYLRLCLDMWNSLGIRVNPHVPEGMEDVAPEFQDYIYEMTFTNPEHTPVSFWPINPPPGTICYYGGCPASSRAERNLWQIDQLLKMGIGGVYLDGQVYPQLCGNRLHDHEVIDPLTGQPTQAFRIFDKREYLKRMYCLVKSYRLDAVVDAHCSSGLPSPIMSFVTNTTDGESLGAMDWLANIQPPVVRADYHARQYGFNGEAIFYNNSPVPVEMGMATMGIHGQTPRCFWGMVPERAQKVWAGRQV